MELLVKLYHVSLYWFHMVCAVSSSASLFDVLDLVSENINMRNMRMIWLMVGLLYLNLFHNNTILHLHLLSISYFGKSRIYPEQTYKSSIFLNAIAIFCLQGNAHTIKNWEIRIVPKEKGGNKIHYIIMLLSKHNNEYSTHWTPRIVTS
ncbi:hypothetical protein ACJX0J_026782, partial [Zea mays]